MNSAPPRLDRWRQIYEGCHSNLGALVEAVRRDVADAPHDVASSVLAADVRRLATIYVSSPSDRQQLQRLLHAEVENPAAHRAVDATRIEPLQLERNALADQLQRAQTRSHGLPALQRRRESLLLDRERLLQERQALQARIKVAAAGNEVPHA